MKASRAADLEGEPPQLWAQLFKLPSCKRYAELGALNPEFSVDTATKTLERHLSQRSLHA